MERAWRDIRKDCLELFRRIFLALEESGCLSMDIRIHRMALFLVFQHRIQANLDDARRGWNAHPLRTEGNRSPFLIWTLSKAEAESAGEWDNPGDTVAAATSGSYGVEDIDDDELRSYELDSMDGPDEVEEIDSGIRVNSDLELDEARQRLEECGFDVGATDDNYGINVYMECVRVLSGIYPDESHLALSGGFAEQSEGSD